VGLEELLEHPELLVLWVGKKPHLIRVEGVVVVLEVTLLLMALLVRDLLAILLVGPEELIMDQAAGEVVVRPLLGVLVEPVEQGKLPG
jgi:hypothetical protein